MLEVVVGITALPTPSIWVAGFASALDATVVGVAPKPREGVPTVDCEYAPEMTVLLNGAL